MGGEENCHIIILILEVCYDVMFWYISFTLMIRYIFTDCAVKITENYVAQCTVLSNIIKMFADIFILDYIYIFA